MLGRLRIMSNNNMFVYGKPQRSHIIIYTQQHSTATHTLKMTHTIPSHIALLIEFVIGIPIRHVL